MQIILKVVFLQDIGCSPITWPAIGLLTSNMMIWMIMMTIDQQYDDGDDDDDDDDDDFWPAI